MTLNYRLNSINGSSLTLKRGEQDADAIAESDALELVMAAMERAHGWRPFGTEYTAEILEDSTISKMEMLEDLVDQMYGLLSDICYADSTPGEKEIEKMLDEAAKKMGYEDE